MLGFLGLKRMEVDPPARATSSRSPASSFPRLRHPLRSAQPEALPPLVVDEPTISMTFEVNNSPFAGPEASSYQPPDPRAPVPRT